MRSSVLSRMLALSCCILLGAGVVFAQEATTPEAAAQETAAMKVEVDGKIQTLLNAPAGVFDVEYDNGQLMRLKLKGEAEVSTALSGARADRQARQKAELLAKAAFSKFLNEQVTVVESNTDGFVIKEKNGTESADYLDASQKTVAAMSSSFQRGLTVLLDHIDGDGANRKAVIILGWSKKSVAASAHAQDTMEKSRVNKGQSPAPAAGKAAPNAGTQTRTGDIENF